MFGCVGCGVAIPLPGLVGVGVADGIGVASSPMMLTHAYASAQRPPQEGPAAGFQARNLASVMPNFAVMDAQASSRGTK